MDGLNELRELERLVDQIRERAKLTMKQAAIGIPRALKPLTPIDTGHLRRSWKGRYSTYQTRIRNTAFYADFVESGTSRTRAQPMITPLLPTIEAELERSISTGTDFYLDGSAYPDTAQQLKDGYRSRYGSYGSEVGFEG